MIATMAATTIPDTPSIVVTETYVVATSCSAIILIPDSPVSFCELAILDTVEGSPHSFGFVKRRSFVDNAKLHVGASYVLNIDVKDFFPSIGILQVRKMFKALGYRDAVALTLAEIATYNGVLPQGAPTSPSLANMYMLEVDSILNEIAAAPGSDFPVMRTTSPSLGRNGFRLLLLSRCERPSCRTACVSMTRRQSSWAKTSGRKSPELSSGLTEWPPQGRR
jgi:hypothetical protein